MQPGDNTDLNNLFGPAVQYQVPLYQRRYVWDESNWVALWRDILARLGLEPIEEKDPKDPESLVRRCEQSIENVSQVIYQGKHFTGVIVTDPIQPPESLERFEVIDGQQRLTTFQIILCVIRDIFKSNKHTIQVDDAEQMIVNNEAVAMRYPEANHKFVLTQFDRDEFKAVANGEYGVLIPDAFDKESNRLDNDELSEIKSIVFKDPEVLGLNVLSAYGYFYEWIRIYMEKDFDFKKLDDLLKTIQTQFIVVKIQLETTDKSEKIFESINATGRKLSEFDYIRNNLFLRARSLGEGEKSKKSYRNIFYERYWHFENRRSYWTPERLEEFLETFLIVKFGPECFDSIQVDGTRKKTKKAFEVYQDQYIKNIKKLEDEDIIKKLEDIEKLEDEDIESELEDEDMKLEQLEDKDIKRKFIELKLEIRELERYSEEYKNANPDPDDKFDDYREIGIRMQFYRDLKIQSFLPFVLHLKNEMKISDIELELVYKSLESYILRRLVYFDFVIEDEQAYSVIDACFSNLIDHPQFNVEDFIKCLSNEDNEDNEWWPNNKILENRGLPRIMNRLKPANEEENTEKSQIRDDLSEIMDEMRDRILSTQHRAMLVISYIFYRIEKHIDKDKKDKLHFEKFLSYEPKRMVYGTNVPEAIYNNIGNLTFLEKDKSFNDSNLKLNQELNEELNEELKLYQMEIETKNKGTIRRRTIDLINKRREILFSYFCQIWPDHGSILEEIRRNRELQKNES